MVEDTDKGLAARLWKLAKFVRERVSEGRQSGTIVEVGTPYVKAAVTNFSYGDQGAINIANFIRICPKARVALAPSVHLRSGDPCVVCLQRLRSSSWS